MSQYNEQSKQPKILIVDDDPVNADMLKYALAKENKVEIASTGKEALATCFRSPVPDLIILDIQLPDFDGFEIITELKASEETKHIPVMFVTAREGADDQVKGLELGAMDYIIKPYVLPIVVARVRNQLALKQKNDLLERLVSMDGLTEIPNRRFFEQMLDREWRRGMRMLQPLSIIMMDIDHFKAFNDNYGHRQGDNVLIAVARCIDSCVHRGADLVARYGGEEFVALLSDTKIQSACQLAEGIREKVESLAISHEYSSASSVVTISCGVATLTPSRGIMVDELINAADKQLYCAKNSGRNTVCS
ncbi:diguanylate cyclase [Algicola sagamiensis]|uniref:diguanylate cyclase n=1 Tax=Algicola sagamiensis TaxID=163869 RepID=UPI00037462FD|nr:diguanylate cyclase [Algicola sagamiensis]